VGQVRQIRTVTRHATRTTARGTTQITTTTRSVTTRHHKTRDLESARANQPGSPALAFAYWGAALAVTVLAHGWIVTHLIPDSDGRGWDHGLIGGAKFWMPNYNPVGLFAQYSIGVITAGLIAYRQRLLKLGRTTLPARHGRFDLTLILAGIAAVWLLWNLRHADEFGFSLGRQPYAFPFFAILVALMLYAAPFSVRAYKLLDNPFARLTARISFGLYIWHYPILELVRLLHNPDYKYFGIASLPEWFTISAFVLGTAYWIASLSYRHIEAPFLRETGRRKSNPQSRSQLEPPREVSATASP
jgi:peptidoglycan/LPS O-acetylase OafA/YrhL